MTPSRRDRTPAHVASYPDSLVRRPDEGRQTPGERRTESLEAVLLDRFSTTVEDPRTGRAIV